MQPLLSGISAGFLSTGPMTLALFRMQQSLPASQRSPLPPATITHDLTESVGAAPYTGPTARVLLTLMSHFAYGAAMGGVYSLTFARFRVQGALKGSVFGLGVWAGSYLGWAPAIGIRASAPRMPMKRNLMMIGAHLVWGGCLGWGEEMLRRSGAQMLDGARKAPRAE